MSRNNTHEAKEIRRLHRAIRKERFAQTYGDMDHFVRLDNGKYWTQSSLNELAEGIEWAEAVAAAKEEANADA